MRSIKFVIVVYNYTVLIVLRLFPQRLFTKRTAKEQSAFEYWLSVILILLAYTSVCNEHSVLTKKKTNLLTVSHLFNCLAIFGVILTFSN